MNRIRRIRRSLADLNRRAGALPADGVAAPAVLGQLTAAATLLDQAPTGARLQPPGDQRRPAQPAGHRPGRPRPYSVPYDLRGHQISALRIYFPMSLLIDQLTT